MSDGKNCCYKCPRRKAHCAVDCPDWAERIAQRERQYAQRARENDITSASIEVRENRIRVSRQGDKYAIKKKRGAKK